MNEKESLYWAKCLRLIVVVTIFYSAVVIILTVWGNTLTLTQQILLYAAGIVLIIGNVLYYNKYRGALAKEEVKKE